MISLAPKKKEPKVGVGVIVVNDSGRVLVGKRRGGHAPYYSIPGGHLELGESFEIAAIREIKEETDLDIENPKVIAVTNNLETFSLEGIHYISVILHCYLEGVFYIPTSKDENQETNFKE